MYAAALILLVQAFPSAPQPQAEQVTEIRTILEIYDDDKEGGVVTVELHLGDDIRRWEYGAGAKWDDGFFTRFIQEVDFTIGSAINPRVFVELKDQPGEVRIRTGIKANVFLFSEGRDEAPIQFSGQHILDTGLGRGRFELSRMQAATTSRLDPVQEKMQANLVRATAPGVTSESAARRTYFFTKLWQRGSKLKIAFRDGTPEMWREFAKIACEWTGEGRANLILDFGANLSDAKDNSFYQWNDGNAREYEIRVAFEEELGSWSMIGVDSRNLEFSPNNGTSLNLPASIFKDFKNPNAGSQITLRSSVLHEFGHALGLYHMFQHPDANCDFLLENEPGYVVTRDDDGKFIPDSAGRRPGLIPLLTGSPNFWNRQSILDNFRPHDTSYMPIKPSADSVMMYAFPPEYFRLGEKSPWYRKEPLSKLSESDITLIQTIYPHFDKGGLSQVLASIDQSVVATVASAESVNKHNLDQGWERLDVKKGPEERIEGAKDPALGDAYLVDLMNSISLVCLFRSTDKFTHSELGDKQKGEGFGTGFLISPTHVLTCNHVMPVEDDAESSEVMFWRMKSPMKFDPVTFSLADKAIIFSSPIGELDFSIVELKRGTDGKTPGESLGYYDLQESKKKSLYSNVGLLNVIHYPRGQNTRQYDLRSKSLKLLGKPPKDNYIAYDALTAGGSSGAPVFNDLWRVVALHRGRQDKGDEPIDFFDDYSKGVRIDRIIQHVLDNDMTLANQLGLKK